MYAGAGEGGGGGVLGSGIPRWAGEIQGAWGSWEGATCLVASQTNEVGS